MRIDAIKMTENLARVVLIEKFKNDSPTESDILEVTSKFRAINDLSDEEFDQVIKNLHSCLSVEMDEGIVIKGDNEFQPWYDERRAELEFKYWNRYEQYLLKKGWSPKVVNTVDKVSNDIMSLLGDPKQEGGWKRRGLVIGDVQSGKTANFTAICNKAVDVGYKVIIILTGTLESLRKQTQERQDSDLVGLDSYFMLNENKKRKYIGVGEFNNNIRLMTFTSTRNDFRSAIVQNVGLSLSSCTDTALFVVKKNKSVLENLEKWLKTYNADSSGKIDSSVLIIDDESDNASVNTKKEDENPTTINRCIRNLLNCFTKESYVAITATPYANIFINDETDSAVEEQHGQDLFPRDFIYCLSAPSNYIGAKDIYLTNGKHHKSLEIIDDMDNLLPLKHKNTIKVKYMSDSLKEAVYYFVLVNAIRDFRGHKKSHRSMLVNVSRFTNIQNQYVEILEDWLEEIKRNTNNFANLSSKDSEKNEHIRKMHEVWNKFNLEDISKCDWEEIRTKYLAKALFTIKVQAVNQSSSSKSLDYSTFKESGFRVIAVGGISLSRGITLEGLCVSYFYRNSQSYDTLMQMGRWFGYREHYDDLCKIWMTEGAINWYKTICEATEELKREIQKMNNKNLTPKEFGLKVRENPASLIVTAKNKMRNTKTIERYIDYSGKLTETRRIDCKTNLLKQNYDLVVGVLKNLNINLERVNKSSYILRDVGKQAILEIINNFNDSYVNILQGYNQEAISEFIEKPNHLEKWDVIIPSGSIKETVDLDIGKEKITIQKEERRLEYEPEKKFISVYDGNKQILADGSLKIGLDEKQLSNINDDEIGKAKYLFKERNPLMFIHFIDGSNILDLPEDVEVPYNTFIALSLAFPKTDDFDKTKVKVRYRINTVKIKNFLDFEEDDSDDL